MKRAVECALKMGKSVIQLKNHVDSAVTDEAHGALQ